MGSYTNVAGWMEAMGVPGALLPLVIALEVLGHRLADTLCGAVAGRILLDVRPDFPCQFCRPE